jgi:hypothetical protein
MTAQYFVQVSSPEMLALLREVGPGAGLAVVEAIPVRPTRLDGSEPHPGYVVIIDDHKAPEDLDGHWVAPVFSRDVIDGVLQPAVLVDRQDFGLAH